MYIVTWVVIIALCIVVIMAGLSLIGLRIRKCKWGGCRKLTFGSRYCKEHNDMKCKKIMESRFVGEDKETGDITYGQKYIQSDARFTIRVIYNKNIGARLVFKFVKGGYKECEVHIGRSEYKIEIEDGQCNEIILNKDSSLSECKVYRNNKEVKKLNDVITDIIFTTNTRMQMIRENGTKEEFEIPEIVKYNLNELAGLYIYLNKKKEG